MWTCPSQVVMAVIPSPTRDSCSSYILVLRLLFTSLDDKLGSRQIFEILLITPWLTRSFIEGSLTAPSFINTAVFPSLLVGLIMEAAWNLFVLADWTGRTLLLLLHRQEHSWNRLSEASMKAGLCKCSFKKGKKSLLMWDSETKWRQWFQTQKQTLIICKLLILTETSSFGVLRHFTFYLSSFYAFWEEP